MSHLARGLTAAALTFMLATPAEAQFFGRRNNDAAAPVINETLRCTQNLGTVAIAETQGALFGQMGIGTPTELLRTVIRESGCFTLIDRGPGMSAVERERGMGGAGRARTADFVLVAELSNPIDEATEERRSGLLSGLASVGGRALLNAGMAAATGGMGGGDAFGGLNGLGGLSGLGGGDMGLNPMQMQALNMATNMLGGQQQQAQPLNNSTIERIRDIKKDIGRGKEDAQVVFSLSSVHLAETVGNTRAIANKDDVKRLRIRDNHFGGRVGAGYESEDEGKVIALALVRGYANLVTNLGGMGSETPEVTLANREAVRAAAAERDAEAARVAQGERRERERAEREREDERRRMREEIRREDEEARRSASRPSSSMAMSTSMSSRQLALPSVLRSAPDGAAIRPLAADDVVFPTGKTDGPWVEVLDADDNIGWLQRERLARGN